MWQAVHTTAENLYRLYVSFFQLAKAVLSNIRKIRGVFTWTDDHAFVLPCRKFTKGMVFMVKDPALPKASPDLLPIE